MSETIEKDGYRIEIEQDEIADNPIRDMDFLFKFLIYHRNYDFGHNKQELGFPTPESFLEHIKAYPQAIYLPLYMFDHSGITISLGCSQFRAQDSHGWDWGQVGWLWAPRKYLLQELGGKILTKKKRERALEIAAAEVKMVDDYLTGNVHQYSIYDADGELKESCGGFVGDEEYCKEEALNMLLTVIDCDQKAELQRKEEALNKLSPALPGFAMAV